MTTQPTIKKTKVYGICSHISRGCCSDIGYVRFGSKDRPQRWHATFYDARGRMQTRTFCAHHAVKFATRHNLIQCLHEEGK